MSNSDGKDGLQQGGFQFGPSQFDMGAIANAVGGNQQTTEARYNQLGMGGSTPEKTDLAQQGLLGQAAAGQLQTSEVGNPAFNPALQPVQQDTSGSTTGKEVGTALGTAAQLGSAFL